VFAVRVDASTRTLHPSGEIDLATAPQFRRALEEAAATGEQLVVDMAEITFIDSAGLHALVTAAVSMDGGAPLVLERVPPSVLRLLKIVGMDGLPSLEIRSTG
jgi:anti-anti-sigma factor